jgi:phospholipid N-methyltransferase
MICTVCVVNVGQQTKEITLNILQSEIRKTCFSGINQINDFVKVMRKLCTSYRTHKVQSEV